MGREDEIRLIAYNLWDSENRPEGRHLEHWAKAEALWRQQDAKLDSTLKAKPNPKRAAAKKTTTAKPAARRARPKKSGPENKSGPGI